MSRARLTLLSLAVLLTLLAAQAVMDAPGGLAQGTPTPVASPEIATPIAPPPAACGPEVDPATPMPTGVVREERLAVPVAHTTESVEAVSTLVCIAPNTTITYEVPGSPPPPTDEIGQDFSAQLVVVEGTLQIKLVKRCAFNPTSAACTETNGVASYRTVDDYVTPVDIGAGWSTIPVGAIVSLSDVTVSIRTTDTTARYLATGVVVEAELGSGCPSSCFRHPP